MHVEFSLTMLDGFILQQKNSNQEGFVGLIYEYLPSIVITAGNFLVPALGDQIALVERYSPSTTIILALLRFALLLGCRNRRNISSLYVQKELQPHFNRH